MKIDPENTVQTGKFISGKNRVIFWFLMVPFVIAISMVIYWPIALLLGFISGALGVNSSLQHGMAVLWRIFSYVFAFLLYRLTWKTMWENGD